MVSSTAPWATMNNNAKAASNFTTVFVLLAMMGCSLLWSWSNGYLGMRKSEDYKRKKLSNN